MARVAVSGRLPRDGSEPTISSASMVLSLNAVASEMTLVSSTHISAWADQSGNGNNGSQSTDVVRMIYTATGGPLNGPYVAFDKDALSFVEFADVFSGLTAAEVFIVRKVTEDPPAFAEGFWKFGTSAAGDAIPFSDGVVYSGFGSTVRKTSGDPNTSMTGWHIYNVTTTATEWTDRINGVQIFTTGTNTVAFEAACWLGRGLASGSDGGMTAIRIFNAKLSTADRVKMTKWLMRKYGI